MLTSSSKLENEIVITTSFTSIMNLVDARREDEKLLSGVVAETMKLLGKSSYGYQIMDRSMHKITEYLNDERLEATNEL